MGKLLVAIDISLNSTAICFNDGKTYKYLSLLNRHNVPYATGLEDAELIEKHDYLKFLDEIPEIEIELMNRKPVKKVQTTGKGKEKKTTKININEYHKTSFMDSINQSNLTTNAIIDRCKGYDDVEIFIEHYSYNGNSNSDNEIQLHELTAQIKRNLVTDLLMGNIGRLHVIPGPNIKQLAKEIGLVGEINVNAPPKKETTKKNSTSYNGLPDKYGMLIAYVNDINNQNHGLYKMLISKFDTFVYTVTKKKAPFKQVYSPINDIIDAHWIMKFAEAKF